MDQQRLEYKAIAYSREVFIHEQRVLVTLGMPEFGREWFADPDNRLQFLIKARLLNDIRVVELELARMYG